ncbi:hypothetical protein N9M74_00340 [Pontimonas sp.]|nr:hypothetical protein [Pontimonas sp.]
MKAFVLFHLNADYSSIPEKDLETVFSSCYEQILRLQDSVSLPLALEMTGSTALKMDRISPPLVESIRTRIREEKIAIVSGGLYQIIGPLVPPEITYRNHQRGKEVLAEIFGVMPKITLPSEQAISEGSLSVLKDAGYLGAIVDRDNLGLSKQELNPAFTPAGLKLIWASSSVYQWVQYYVNGDITLDEIVARIMQRVSHYGGDLPFPLYSGDAETFGFRPGRYTTEGEVDVELEWGRFAALITKLREECNFDFTCEIDPEVTPAGKKFPVFSPSIPEEPIRVKKQPKYNVSRWAVSGRGDFELNAYCWETFEKLMAAATPDQRDWDRLLWLWSSDFRTHTTSHKWDKLRGEIPAPSKSRVESFANVPSTALPPKQCVEDGRFIEVTTSDFVIVIDKNRGLAISSVRRKDSPDSLFGTVPHGTFLRPDLSPDWYSGNMTFQIPGSPQITDLVRCQAVSNRNGSNFTIDSSMKFSEGTLQKRVTINLDSSEINIKYLLPVFERNGSLRLGYVSILRAQQESLPLRYSTKNGGYREEVFAIHSEEFEMGAAVNHLVTARTGLGMTGGWIHFFRTDMNDQFLLTFKQSQNPYLGLLSNSVAPEGALTRFCLTAMERDDTLVPGIFETSTLGYTIAPGRGVPAG